MSEQPVKKTESTKPNAAASLFGAIGNAFKKMKFMYILIGLGVITAIYLIVAIYFGFLSFSVYNIGLRVSIVVLLLLWSVPLLIKFSKERQTANRKKTAFKQVKWGWKVPTGVAIVLALVFICLAIFTTPLFMAKDYRDLVTVDSGESVNFKEDVQNYDEMLVAIVDKDMANKLAQKLLGDKNYGSQFSLGELTMQYYQGDICWVAPLEYNGFFEWANASKNGSPGYVVVSATDPEQKPAKFIEMNIKYLRSAYFGQDADRKMYFSNMAKVRDSKMSFEIDETGTPYFIQATMKKAFGATSADQTTGIIVMNAITGECKFYANGQEPAWIDRVYPAQLIMDQVGYWGKYTHGFWNTLFAKKEVNATTEGYNYCYNNGAFYLTTGVTSVAADDSLFGLVMANLRTKDVNFYNVSGAIETAAMKSAEGKRQDLGYKSSIPTLVNFNGEPTYFMVLKDDAGLAKSYAYVNVKSYNKLAVEDNQALAAINYAKAIAATPGEPGVGEEEVTLEIGSIKEVTVGGFTTYYIKFVSTDEKYANKVFKANILLNSELPFIEPQNSVTVKISGEDIVSLKLYEAPPIVPAIPLV